MWLPSTRTTPKPRLAAPGSIPITTCMGSDSGTSLGCLPSALPLRRRPSFSRHLVLGDVEVGVDLVDVVVLLERVEQAQQRVRRRALDLDRALRLHRTSADSISTPAPSSASRTALRSRRLADHPQLVAVLAHVLGAGVDRGDQVVLAVAAAVDRRSTPRFSKIQATEPGSPRLPPCLVKAWRTSALVRLRLSVSASTRIAAPPGP